MILNQDSLLNIIDSLRNVRIIPYILDTSKVFINNSNPDKSFWEVLTLWTTPIISILAIYISFKLAKKTIDENNKNLQEQIKAERKKLTDENVIQLRKEWIRDFSIIISNILTELYELSAMIIRKITMMK